MKVKINTPVRCAGKAYEKGDICECSERDARILVGSGAASIIGDDKPKQHKPKPGSDKK